MRASRSLLPTRIAGSTARLAHSRPLSVIAAVLLLCASLPQSGALAARRPTGSGLAAGGPLVTGVDFTLAASQFKYGPSELKEGSLKKDLTLPACALDATFTSAATKAPVEFTDIGPRWSADVPDD